MTAPLRILIVDDEKPARDRLRTLLGDIAGQLPSSVVGEAENGVAGLAALDATPADVVLVDIRMPRMDGIEFARHLSRLPTPPALVFTTAYDSYAVEAFELSAIDYLLKPIRAERLEKALQRVAQRQAAAAAAAGPSAPLPDPLLALQDGPRRFLSCHERGRLLLVPVEEILCLKADLKYVAAVTAEREYLLDESLVKLEQEFAQHFIRLHRSVLAAREALVGFERSQDADGEHWVALVRGLAEKLPVSRRQWPLLKQYARQPG